ncbi:hypothetical protein [Brachybacterium endophyticum]|nr:hypothetical protein [Brachybacterium endophyticum]
MLGALEVLDTASTDPAELMILTDEEIVGLDGGDSLELLGGPYLAQPGIDADASAASAIRSLAARHLLTPTGDASDPEGDFVVGDEESPRRPFQLDRALAGVLALRRTPEVITTIARTLAGGSTTLGHYVFPGGGVLEEYVTVDGFHHFSVPDLSVVPQRVHAFVDPFEDASEDGDVEVLTVPGPDVDQVVEGARSLSVLTVVAEEAGAQATVIAFPGRVRVLDNGPIRTDDDPVGCEISDVSPTGLRSIIEALTPGRSADDAGEPNDSRAGSGPSVQ